MFEELATRFRVTIATARTGRPVLDETDQAIMENLAGKKGRSTSEIAEAIELSPRATRLTPAAVAGFRSPEPSRASLHWGVDLADKHDRTHKALGAGGNARIGVGDRGRLPAGEAGAPVA